MGTRPQESGPFAHSAEHSPTRRLACEPPGPCPLCHLVCVATGTGAGRACKIGQCTPACVWPSQLTFSSWPVSPSHPIQLQSHSSKQSKRNTPNKSVGSLLLETHSATCYKVLPLSVREARQCPGLERAPRSPEAQLPGLLHSVPPGCVCCSAFISKAKCSASH